MTINTTTARKLLSTLAALGGNYPLAVTVSKAGATEAEIAQAKRFAGLDGAEPKKAAPALIVGLIVGKHIQGDLASAVRTLNNARAAVAEGAQAHREFVQGKVQERAEAKTTKAQATAKATAARTKAEARIAKLTAELEAAKAAINA